MKLFRGAIILLAVAFIASAAHQASAVTYLDSTGENFTGAGGGILDIASVEVTQPNATDLMFKINLTGNPTSPTDWGKYMLSFDTVAGGDTTGNGWGRPIALTSGMDYWIGSWADSGFGVQLWKFTGAWAQIGGAGPFAGGPSLPGLTNFTDSSSMTIKVAWADLGLLPGSVLCFDVYTSGGGGGDSAVDSLANPAQTISDWPGPYSSALCIDYTIVPEPSTLLLVGFGGLMLIGRIFRRRA